MDDLTWFYRGLPGLGVATVLHLGHVTGAPLPDLADRYPSVEGVVTFENWNTDAPLAARDMHERKDWIGCDGRFQIFHGASRHLHPVPLTLFHGAGDKTQSLAQRVRRREWQFSEGYDTDTRSEIMLLGSHRRIEHRYYQNARGDQSFAATVGIFEAKPRYRNPPDPYGGTIVEVQLGPDGTLSSCVIRFRDMSGGMPDVRPVERLPTAA